MVLVGKKDGGNRFYIDFRVLNQKTPLDGFPMLQIPEILESLHGAAVFSILDLKSGYWQVAMSPESIPKTAFVTKMNNKFFRLPFGLKNAVAATFERLMTDLLREEIGKSCFVYIDDIVVYSSNVSSHLQPLQRVFAIPEAARLTVNLKKCNL